MSTTDPQPVSIADLTEEVRLLRTSLTDQIAIRRKHSRRVGILAIMFAIMLSITLFSSWQLRQSQLGACQIGNDTRAKQVQLWTHVISISSSDETQQQRQQATAFLWYVRNTFHQLNCAQIYHLAVLGKGS